MYFDYSHVHLVTLFLLVDSFVGTLSLCNYHIQACTWQTTVQHELSIIHCQTINLFFCSLPDAEPSSTTLASLFSPRNRCSKRFSRLWITIWRNDFKFLKFNSNFNILTFRVIEIDIQQYLFYKSHSDIYFRIFAIVFCSEGIKWGRKDFEWISTLVTLHIENRSAVCLALQFN